ncbi:MAG: hypothetical protein GY703_02920 [Gammaproteobacteria bacterium]|nr:hypothetical protein [Gammaproteobacteria bacterium]
MLHSPKLVTTGFFLFLFAVVSVADDSAQVRLVGEVAQGMDYRLSIQQIESIGLIEIESYSPYDKRADRFAGVWLDQLVAHFGKPEVTRVTMRTIDDYEVEFTPSEWKNSRILMVTRVNGKHISFATKGPIRIIIPGYDPREKAHQVSLPKWIWMITRMEFR